MIYFILLELKLCIDCLHGSFIITTKVLKVTQRINLSTEALITELRMTVDYKEWAWKGNNQELKPENSHQIPYHSHDFKWDREAAGFSREYTFRENSF